MSFSASTYAALLSSISNSSAIRLESIDPDNKVVLRDIESGTYVLYGMFLPYTGADTTIYFTSDLLASVIKSEITTSIQVFYPVDNRVQYLEITDLSCTSNDVYLSDLPGGNNTSEEDTSSGSKNNYQIANAIGDGITDDTDALNIAMNRSNTIIDGGNRRYKYMIVDMTQVEDLEIRNVIFYGGQQMNLYGCKNVTFRNCQWVGVNNNGVNKACYGVALREDPDSEGTMPGCENISFYGCTFKDIWYNNLFVGKYAHHSTGQAIQPMSVHNMTVKDCLFTQIKGNAAIHFNSAGKLGFVDISDNLFYLTCFGGVCLYAYESVYPTVNGKLHGNRFIGCGLGYLPDDYLFSITENQRGVGCAALLGGADKTKAPYKQHFSCENNIFIDCCESSIEGPAWNPCIGNYCKGQGSLQSEENCRLMEEKYKLDYTLHVRYNPSANFIYRNLNTNVDDSYVYEDNDPIIFKGNVMGESYVDRNGFIHLTGKGYNTPVIITDNVMEVNKSGKIHTHFLNCYFRKGLRFENNHGIQPYFNSCKLDGDVIIDDMLNAWNTDFSECNLRTLGDRFPEARLTNYDSTVTVLENDQANVVNGTVTLTAYDTPIVAEAPTDYTYTIESADGYEAGTGFVFPGPDNPTHIDTGIELLKDGGDFTIYVRYFGDDTDAGTTNSGYNPLFMMWDADASTGGLIFGGKYANKYTSVMLVSNTTSLNLDTGKGYMRMNTSGMKTIMRRKGSQIEFWLSTADADATTMADHLVLTTSVPESGFDGQTGTLLIGARDGYYGDDTRSLSGRMEAFKVFPRAISNSEASMLLYGKDIAEEEVIDPSDSMVYDLSADERYDTENNCVSFDGTFGIDTGIELFSNSNDFTVTVQFDISNYHDAGLPNFSFIPVLSSMNYAEDYKQSPGFDVGLSLQLGDNLDAIPKGGFIMLRNSWKFSNGKYIDSSRYFGYSGVKYGVILIRQSGVLSVYDYNMQRLITINGEDVTSIFSGTLRIGENMTVPTLAGDNRLIGNVYECKVYNRALTLKEIEVLYPNIYSNEFRTKGTVSFMVPNRRYVTQNVSYIRMEMLLDMGDYATSEFAGKYPKAVGVKFDSVDDIIWVGTGSNGYVKKTLYKLSTIKPYRNFIVKVTNTGLAPGLEAKIRGFRCVLLGAEKEVIESIDALDFNVEWDNESMQIPIGDTLNGHVSFIPEDSNTGTELTISADSDIINVTQSDELITITGITEGETILTISIPSGTTKTYQITVDDSGTLSATEITE